MPPRQSAALPSTRTGVSHTNDDNDDYADDDDTDDGGLQLLVD